MIRSWLGVQTVAGTAQPVFGTTITTAFNSPAQSSAGNTPPASSPAVAIAVGSSKGFVVSDRILVGPAASFVPASRGTLDQGTVASIVDATHITVTGLTKNHPNTDIIVLNEVASFVEILPVAAAAAMYLGTDSTVASNDASVFDVIGKLSGAGAEPTYWHTSSPNGKSDAYQTQQYWLVGTAADTFVARFHQN